MKTVFLILIASVIFKAVAAFPQMTLHEWALWGHGMFTGVLMIYWFVVRREGNGD